MNKIATILVLLLSYYNGNSQTPELADEYWNKAEKAAELEDWKNAAKWYEKSAEAEKKSPIPRLEDLVFELNNAAFYNNKNKNYKKAIVLYEETLAATESVLGKANSRYGICLNNLAQLYVSMGQYDKALPLYLEALENIENALGKEHSDYGTCLNNLAVLYKLKGQYDKALPLYLAALGNIEKSVGKKDSEYGIRLNNLAQLYKSMGQYDEALSLYLEAQENIENALGKEHSSYGILLNNLAQLYESLGQNDKALPIYLEGLEITENALGKEHSEYGICLNNLAQLYKSMGQYDKALPLYLEAQENTEKSLGKEHPEYGIRLNNLAQLYEFMGQYNKASYLYIEALENTENSVGKEHSKYGIRLNNLASLYETMGQYEKALTLYLEALENTKKALGKEHSRYGTLLSNLAGLHEAMGQYAKELAVLSELNKNTITQIEQSFSFQNEKGKEVFINNIVGTRLNRFSQYNFNTNNLYKEGVSLANNNILTSKGLLLSSSKNVLSQLESLNQKEIDAKISQFRRKKSSINRQLQLPISERVTNFNEEQEDLELLGREITRLYSTHFGEEISYIKDWRKNQLKENELAIEFTHFDVTSKKLTDSTMYVAYLYKSDWAEPKAVNLFEEKELKKYFTSSSSPNELYKTRGSKATSTKAQLTVADSIYKLVWKPLESYVHKSSTIYFSPDGLLHKIPFAALPNEDNELIGELYSIQQMGSTADVGKNNTPPNLDDVLLIGGVNYEYKIDASKQKNETTYSILESDNLLGDEKNRSISNNGFAYLPGTKEEITDISALLESGKQLSGYNATETAFKELSGNSPSVLHIATHGFFFPKLKEKRKNLELIGQEIELSYAENPLLRSGLLFANANYAWQHGNNPYEEEDGILTALEISNLDLKSTDIVILSACETGLGDIEGSEGVYGLQRAFKMAGVKTIIMSLWEVPDAETAEFMNLFYSKWKNYNNPKKAFKESQLQMMKKYRNEPQKWAAFVLFE